MTRSSEGPLDFIRLDAPFAGRCLLLGVGPLLLILAVGSGSWESMLTMLFLSVLCTMGIGALFWLGAAILIGFLLQLFFPFLRAMPGRATARSPSNQGSHSLQNLFQGDHTPLPRSGDPRVAYIRRQRSEGISEDTVRRELRRAGWEEAQVAAALQQAREEGAASGARPETTPEINDGR